MMKLNTKTISLIIVFAALSVVLDVLPVRIPAPYAPYLIYQIWEIPIVAAFLLYGARVGVLITLVNTIILLIWFPGALPSGPLYNMAAILSMLLGMGIVKTLVAKHSPERGGIIAALLTASGVTFRTAFMALVDYIFLRFPPPVGYGLPEAGIIAAIPLVVIFNLTLALYTIPLGYSAAQAVRSYIRM
jgi:riboflavin transporter FmnP